MATRILAYIFIIAVLIGVYSVATSPANVVSTTQPAVLATTTLPVVTTTPEIVRTASTTETAVERPVEMDTPPIETSDATATTEPITEAVRYTTAQIPFEQSAVSAREAIVNIFCVSSKSSTSNIASGSGIFIDSHGVILTNAHVAQYFLLDRYGISCTVRTGAPARNTYTARLLFVPTTWIETHAADINKESPTGTGEDDYALLLITGSTDRNVPLPDTFPAFPFDVREDIARVGDDVLLVSYPAGFLGSVALLRDLWQAATIAHIAQVYTFNEGTIDVLGLGGTLLAQSGSSGGAVINAWGKLVGLISTSSQADTTQERDLHAATLSHIDRSLSQNNDTHLIEFLEGDLGIAADTFAETTIPELKEIYKAVIEK